MTENLPAAELNIASKLITIAGPTASGKTAVAVELAKLIGGEVVSADSMQIYVGMDIGTAKPTVEECAGIPHHMIDVVRPDEAYSAALYQQHARAVIADIYARGRVPILCGGTGFYINAVLYDVLFADDESRQDGCLGIAFKQSEDIDAREYFADFAAIHGPEKLHLLLREADPVAAAGIHSNNIKRVCRALSYIRTTGQLFSEYNTTQKEQPPVYDHIFCRLSVDRPVLYERINRRAQVMFEAGLIDEVTGLMAQGYQPGLVSMQGIGYKEVARYIQGECTRDEAIEAVQQNSRRYAKRQETWFRNQNPHAMVVPVQGTAADVARGIVANAISNRP